MRSVTWARMPEVLVGRGQKESTSPRRARRLGGGVKRVQRLWHAAFLGVCR